MNTQGIVVIVAALITAVFGPLLMYWVNERKKNQQASSSRMLFYDSPTLITAAQHNQINIESDFLLWEECSILLWLFVDAANEGIRSPTSDYHTNRQILAHYTDYVKDKGHRNAFYLRYGSHRKQWEIQFSNNSLRYAGRHSPAPIKDGLLPGWHHFMVTWDKSKPILRFLIDGGKSGGNIATTEVLKSWPEKRSERVTVGSRRSGRKESYIETTIYRLEIFDRYLGSEDDAVKKHMDLKPAP